MNQVDLARVDLGAAHNGRVKVRRVFADAHGQAFIVEKGRYLYLIQWNRRKGAHINYVIAPKAEIL
jgi:hypothetical protein